MVAVAEDSEPLGGGGGVKGILPGGTEAFVLAGGGLDAAVLVSDAGIAAGLDNPVSIFFSSAKNLYQDY
jgi:hypothetical protein